MSALDKAKTVLVSVQAAGLISVLGGIGVLVVLLTSQCNGRKAAENEVARLAEAARLQQDKQTVAERKSASELAAVVKAKQELQTRVDELTKQVGDLKILAVGHYDSGPLPAQGVPRDQSGCLFAKGDTGKLVLDDVHLETEKGNQVAVWSGKAQRLLPLPETDFLAYSGRAPLSTLSIPVPPAANPWGWGASAGLALPGLVQLSAHVVAPKTKVLFLGELAPLFTATATHSSGSISVGFLYW